MQQEKDKQTPYENKLDPLSLGEDILKAASGQALLLRFSKCCVRKYFFWVNLLGYILIEL